jgi:flagellar protein FliS
MTRTQQRPANAYARIGIETSVSAASPHRRILMLLDGALRAIHDARRHMAGGNIPAKGEAISRAISIISQGLAQSLDPARGGNIALQLRELYDYLIRRLLMASLRNDPVALTEVAQLLAGLRDAWAEIAEPTRTESIPNFVPTFA